MRVFYINFGKVVSGEIPGFGGYVTCVISPYLEIDPNTAKLLKGARDIWKQNSVKISLNNIKNKCRVLEESRSLD